MALTTTIINTDFAIQMFLPVELGGQTKLNAHSVRQKFTSVYWIDAIGKVKKLPVMSEIDTFQPKLQKNKFQILQNHWHNVYDS